MRFDVIILGSNSALPAHGRHPSAQVVRLENETFLVDCGEGTQSRLSDCKVKRGRIERIFISHLHGDHFFGLIGLLTSYELMGRELPLHIHAPIGIQEIVEVQLKHSQSSLSFPLHFHATQDERPELVYASKYVSVTSLPLTHRIPTTGFLFQERQRPPRIRKEKIALLDLSIEEFVQIKDGKGVYRDDKLIPHDELVIDSPPGRSYAYCSDTTYSEALIELIKGVDLLYHEATFDQSNSNKAKQTMHSTTHDAAAIALSADVKQLMIGHFSSKYSNLQPLLSEAQEIFSNTILAIDGNTVSIPVAKMAF